MSATLYITFSVSIILFFYLLYQYRVINLNLKSIQKQNLQFLESVEKYVEIFNEQNVTELLDRKSLEDDKIATEIISTIKNDYKDKVIKEGVMTEEHEMLIDFTTLSLSLLIKIPPRLRKSIILENTDNEFIRKILMSKLHKIENHYIPISILEVAISTEND